MKNSNSETDYTQVAFLNVVITGIPDMREEAEGQVVPTPALMLQDSARRQISIIVRKDEAQTFKDVLEKHPDRATIYELLGALLNRMQVEMVGAFVYDLSDYRYLAKVRFKLPENGQVMELDCRPSDAILLSVLGNSPIYMRNSLMEEFSVDLTEILEPH